MVLVSSLEVLCIADNFPITIFVEPIQPIFSPISHLLGDDDASTANNSTLGFLRQIMEPSHSFDILTYLDESIRFQLHHFSTTSYFRYNSMFLYLFVYTHVDDFECLGLNSLDGNKKRTFIFTQTLLFERGTMA